MLKELGLPVPSWQVLRTVRDLNSLQLVGSNGSCPGSTATFTTLGALAPTVIQLLSLDAEQAPFLGGVLWIDPAQQFLVAAVPVVGVGAALDVPIPNSPALVGLSIFAQSAAIEGGAPFGVALSNGVRLGFCPCT